MLLTKRWKNSSVNWLFWKDDLFLLGGISSKVRAWYVIGRLAGLQTCWNTGVIATLWEKSEKRIKGIRFDSDIPLQFSMFN